MNKLTHNFAAKVTAVLLFTITVIMAIGGLIGIYYMSEHYFFEPTVDRAREDIFEGITRRYANIVFYEYFDIYQNDDMPSAEYIRRYEEYFSPANTNFLFNLKNEKGEIVLSNYSGQEIQFSRTYYYEQHNDGGAKETYTIECFVNKTLSASDSYASAEYWINTAYSMRYVIVAVTIISFIACILLYVFLMCSAGRRTDRDQITPNGLDKIPFDIFFGGVMIIGIIVLAVFNTLLYRNTAETIIIITIMAAVYALLFLMLSMSFATRYKLGGWWRNTVIYRIFRFFYRIVYKIFSSIKYLLQHISIIWKAVLALVGLAAAELFIILLTAYRLEMQLLIWFFGKLLLVPLILFIIIQMEKLQTGSQKIASGDLDYRVDTRRMFWEFKKHGENLNNISLGMSRAVDERMKSERFKTELITNVSHDIKTPLTSIINYVDLLNREDLPDGTIKEYVGVLVRQSSRLKKLIDDLVEASKASTGNIVVNSTRTEIGVLLTQAAGEYEKRLRSNELELIQNQPEEEVYIMADGRLLWRVFDNLMNNICKYSQPGTRVYLDLEKVNGEVVITFKNISRNPLNISSEELLERFVRGDSARSTEGSGLGLSIAKSLVELQGGKLDLAIDGDLFKVILKFKTVR